jgi:hypothetical protein
MAFHPRKPTKAERDAADIVLLPSVAQQLFRQTAYELREIASADRDVIEHGAAERVSGCRLSRHSNARLMASWKHRSLLY